MRVFSASVLDDLAARATSSPRRRAHLNVHADAADLVQRFFVAVDRESYIRPHRHLAKSELAIVVRGAFEVITFDEQGAITGRQSIGAGTALLGFEMPRATWHTLIAREDGSTFLEIKEGPYDPATASEFAPWSPPEGDPESRAFLRRLREMKG
ncbi:MAG TPA: WbuC family cupin fold metalloprotein [Steroidobacteraceae bacterium]|nr:WbuC family cupin fold metalloprotein [Steroidobacteraceae bacterium]